MLNNTFDKTIDILSGLVQKHVIINNKIKQCTLIQQNYQELDNRLNNLQKLISSNISNSMKFYKCANVVVSQSQGTQTTQPYFVVQNAVTYPDLNGIYKYAGEYSNDYGSCSLYILQGTTNILYYHKVDQVWYISPSVFISPQDKTFAGEYPYYRAAASTDATQLNLTEFRNLADQPNITCKKYVPQVSTQQFVGSWSGYELILQDGVYIVSETLTEGLSYSAITPVVGNVYSQNASILAVPYMGWEAPYSGLVFYAPLSKASDIAETGQAITTVGTVPYSVIKGIQCANFASRSVGYLNAETTNLPYDNESRTISVWFYINSGAEHDAGTTLFSYGNMDNYNSGSWYTVCAIPKYGFPFGFYGYDDTVMCDFEFDTWYHLCLTKEQGSADTLFYLNGHYIGTHNKGYSQAPTVNDILRFGTICYDDGNRTSGLNGNLAGFRVYNRVLSQEEITTLSNEFTPTTEDVPDLPPEDEVVDKPYGYHLKYMYLDSSPAIQEHYIQEDLTATGKNRTWICINQNNQCHKLAYSTDLDGWSFFNKNNEPIEYITADEDPYTYYAEGWRGFVVVQQSTLTGNKFYMTNEDNSVAYTFGIAASGLTGNQRVWYKQNDANICMYYSSSKWVITNQGTTLYTLENATNPWDSSTWTRHQSETETITFTFTLLE